MKNPVRKRRTRAHVIADLSVNHVERQALKCGFTVERMTHDYGIDLELFTFNRQGEIQEGKVLLQIKATDRVKVRPRDHALAFRVERSDLVSWLAQPMPVILIVYEARREVGYWLYIQSYFRKRQGFNLFSAGKQVTVHVPLKNVLDPAAMRKFARFRNRVLAQMRKLIHDEE